MDIGIPELQIIFVIVLLIFAAGRVSQLGGELGKAIRSFREGLSEEDTKKSDLSQENNGDDKSSSSGAN